MSVDKSKALFWTLSYAIFTAIILPYVYSIEASLYTIKDGCYKPCNSYDTSKASWFTVSSDSFLKISVYTDKSTYLIGDNITIFGYVVDSLNNPIGNARVGIEVKDPNNSTFFLDIVYSNLEGYYTDHFKLRDDALVGTYHVYVSASATGYAPAYNETAFTVQAAGIHDIAILSIICIPISPTVNQTMTISIKVSNLGDYIETFDLYLNYTRLADPQIGKQTITLGPKQDAIINFTWTPNMTGRYQLLAYTSQIPEDINSANNRKESIIYVVSSTGSAQAGSINSEAEMNPRLMLGNHLFHSRAFSLDQSIK